MESEKVGIVIVNWNGKQLLKDCINSIISQNYKNFTVFLVDNGSTDGSIELIKSYYNVIDINLITLDKNYGFAIACNIGIKKVLKNESIKYIALLNNDTTVDKNWLIKLIETCDMYKQLEVNTKIGIVTSKILNYDTPTILDSTGHIFKRGKLVDRGFGQLDHDQYDNQFDIIGACAGGCLYTREMLENIGLFEESFFMNYEDAELSWRAYLQGWKAKYSPYSIIYHKRGGTKEKNKNMQVKLSERNLVNMIYTVSKHGTNSQKITFLIYYILEGIYISATHRNLAIIKYFRLLLKTPDSSYS